MTPTLRGLAIALAIALALVAAAVLTGGPEPALDRALLPDLRDVRSLTWERPGAPPIRISRDPTALTGWAWAEPRGDADARTVEDALAALRGARWHRRRDATGEPATATLIVDGTRTLSIGAPLGTQRWITITGTAYLVDEWVARALTPEPLALRVRRPLAAISSAETIQLSPGGGLGRVSLTGAPRRVVYPFVLLLDPSIATAIEQPLASLEVLELPRGPVQPYGDGIAVDRIVVRDAGPCPHAPALRAIDGTAGPGCVGGGAWDNALRAIWTLTLPPTQLAERRPLPFDPIKLTLPDGTLLDLTGTPRLGPPAAATGPHDADPAAVAELLAALALPAEPVARPPSQPSGTLLALDRTGRSITLELHAGTVVRSGEPVALRLGAGAWAALQRPSAALRDPTPWREEPTTITALQLDNTTYTRGAVLGEWSNTSTPAIVEQLATALAAPVARPRPPGGTTPHTLTLTIHPIGRPPLHRTLRLGTATATGCPATVDTTPLLLPASICDLVRALVR